MKLFSSAWIIQPSDCCWDLVSLDNNLNHYFILQSLMMYFSLVSSRSLDLWLWLMEWVVLPCMNLFVLVMTTSLGKLFVLRVTQLQFKVLCSAVPTSNPHGHVDYMVGKRLYWDFLVFSQIKCTTWFTQKICNCFAVYEETTGLMVNDPVLRTRKVLFPLISVCICVSFLFSPLINVCWLFHTASLSWIGAWHSWQHFWRDSGK